MSSVYNNNNNKKILKCYMIARLLTVALRTSSIVIYCTCPGCTYLPWLYLLARAVPTYSSCTYCPGCIQTLCILSRAGSTMKLLLDTLTSVLTLRQVLPPQTAMLVIPAVKVSTRHLSIEHFIKVMPRYPLPYQLMTCIYACFYLSLDGC